MTTVLVRARVRRVRREDGVVELVRRSPVDMAVSELVLLAALCAGAALLAGGLGLEPALAAAGVVLVGYLAVRAHRIPGRTVALRASPAIRIAPAPGRGRGQEDVRPAPRRTPSMTGPPQPAGLARPKGTWRPRPAGDLHRW